MEKVHYVEEGDKLIVETIYDPSAVIEANKEQRAQGRAYFGSKGQRMLHAARIDMDHIVALKNMGYDLLSGDPEEVRRALRYIQQNEQVWMTVDGQPFAQKKQVWV